MKANISTVILAIVIIALCAAMGTRVSARVLITEVVPDAVLELADGDKVELHNTGPTAVDLTGWVLNDLDPNSMETNPMAEASFAPASFGVPALQPGDFCVVTFASPEAPDTGAFASQPYGIDITVELEPVFHRNTDNVCLFDSAGNMVDSICYAVSDDVYAVSVDEINDMRALTLPGMFSYGLGVLNSQTGWAGPDNVGTVATHWRHVIDFTDYEGEAIGGVGSIQRINVGPQWMEGIPDGGDYFVTTPVGLATLGDYTFDETDGTLALGLTSGSIELYVDFLNTSAFGGEKLADGIDDDDFIIPSALDRVRFRRVMDLMMAGEYTRAHFIANQVGYEVLDWNDTGVGVHFYVLQESADVGNVGFRGMGTYIFDNTSENGLCIQVPHPIFDSLTLTEGGDFLTQVNPRLLMIAGTHRNNSTMDTTCDGTMSNGDPYRISDCAHTVVSFFQMAHEQFILDDPGAFVIQLHGYGTSTAASAEPHDVIISESFNHVPPGGNFSQVWADEIDNQGFIADAGTDPDPTFAAVYNDDLSLLGGRTNTQGRVSNGIQWALACNTYASSVTGQFIHIEQDRDIREENQVVIDALIQTMGLLGVPAELTVLSAE